MINKVKPVLRYPGSKYRKLNALLELLAIENDDNFLDMFGGSGIVGVNVKSIYNIDVTINDFDHNFPLTTNKILKNMLTFQGIGKCYTESAHWMFLRRVRNGYWDKYDKFNDIISKCNITHEDFSKTISKNHNKIYVDPPYDNIKGLYKESFDKNSHIKLRDYLNTHKDQAKILISYNDTPLIRELYKDWHITTMEFQYQTGMATNNNKKRKVNELIITNYVLN